MFGLPMTTVLIMTLIPLFWVVYTAVFLWISRRWAVEDVAEPEDPNVAAAEGGTS